MRLGIFIPSLTRNYDRMQSALWIRALQMIEPLRLSGWDVSLNNPFRRYDAAIYHRGMRRGSLYFVRALRAIARRVYWDTCVDYFDRHESADAEQVACARAIAGCCDGVCVTTEGIAQSARRFSPNVFVMPDPIDTKYFATHKTRLDLDRPIFGWSGVACKAKFLAPYADFLDGRTVIVSQTRPDLPFHFEFHTWRHASFPADLLRCDVAFLPRTLESTYTVNNSAFKALAYASLGIPVIASRLPSYVEMAHNFKSIAFLEDHGGVPQATLDSLKGKSCEPAAVREAYDRFVWGRRLAAWLEEGVA